MTPRTSRTRTTLLALAAAALLAPSALAKPIPMPDDGDAVAAVANATAITRPLKPSLESTTPDTELTAALYLAALAGAATTAA